MKYVLTVTARADRDESCNLYTYRKSLDLGINPPSSQLTRQFCLDVKERFLESWPHPRNRVPTLVPIDVDVRDVHVEGMLDVAA